MLVAILLKQTARQSRVRLIVQGRSIQHVRRNRCSSLFAIIHAHHHRKDPSRKTSQASGNWYQTRSMRHEISRRGVDQIVLFPRCFNAKANSSNLAGGRGSSRAATGGISVGCCMSNCVLFPASLHERARPIMSFPVLSVLVLSEYVHACRMR
jgi:hypothetical protein